VVECGWVVVWRDELSVVRGGLSGRGDVCASWSVVTN
jgi:hypothetical protein